jgi:ABC-type nitrate/sulfonate/bicarbonate transport system ATPase subunit
LHSLGQRSRVSLARTIVKASEHLETLEPERIVEQASDVKAIAQTADLVHGWKDASPQVKIRLDVLGATAEAQITEIEADVSSSDVWDNVSTDVEDY